MKTVALCVAFYGLGVFNCAVFAAVYLLHRPRHVAPTMHNRKWRDAPISNDAINRVFDKIDAMSPDEFACNLAKYSDGPMVRAFCPEVGGIRYEHLGMTGEEV